MLCIDIKNIKLNYITTNNGIWNLGGLLNTKQHEKKYNVMQVCISHLTSHQPLVPLLTTLTRSPRLTESSVAWDGLCDSTHLYISSLSHPLSAVIH